MSDKQKNLTENFTFTTLALYLEALTAAKFNNTLWDRQLQKVVLIDFHNKLLFRPRLGVN
jgi:hypothetical protein